MAFLVATTSLPAVYRPNGYARMTTAGTPHARAKIANEQQETCLFTSIGNVSMPPLIDEDVDDQSEDEITKFENC